MESFSNGTTQDTSHGRNPISYNECSTGRWLDLYQDSALIILWVMVRLLLAGTV